MKKNLPDKKYILIALASLIIILGPFAAETTFAWLPSVFPSIEDIFASLGNVILWIVSWVLWLAAQLFEMTLKLTLNNGAFAKISAINLGWKIIRDVVNLFFIFILLYIAIGAILRLAGHDTKKLLVNLIIAALLINFSLPITKAIIDASNILALEFYDNIGKDKDGNDIGVTRTMMNGLRLTSVYNNKVLEIPPGTADKEGAAFQNIIIGAIGGSALILVTAFVFLAATSLFIFRTIILLFLMILSPLAFGAMILPNTKQYADRWWKELGCQCLLAPAFMFMIYLVVMIINNEDFSAVISGIGGNQSASIAEAFTSGIEKSVGVVLNFLLLIGLMIGSLIISKNLACAGGSQAMAAANWTKGKVQGYAKSYGKRGIGTAAEYAMEKGKKIEEKGGRWGKIMGVIRKTPGVGRGLAALSAGREEELAAKRKQYEKQYKGYSDTGLQTMLETEIITPEKREVIKKIQTGRQVKKEIEAKEKAKYKEIVGGEETEIEYEKEGKTVKEKITTIGKLGEINEQLSKITGGINKDIGSYLDGIEAELGKLSGNTSGRAQQRQGELVFNRNKINRLMKEKEKLEAIKEKLEEKQQSETEKKKLEERLGKLEQKPEPKEII
ncbi:MAG: hypothetical protein HYW71_02570 [Candidatus Niyogibacteria bacterium]|nr:hypothetical protein [Candidatus Niyogibacteria bacterium]